VASFSLVSTASCAPPVLQPAVVSQSYLDRAFAKSDQVARPDPDFGDGLGLGLSSGLSLNSNSSGGSSLLFSNSASGLGSGLGSGMGPGMGSSSGSWALPAHLSESSAPALSSGSWTLSHIPNTFSTTAPVSLAAFPEQPRIHALQLPYNPPVVDCPIRPAVSLAYKQYKPLHLRLFMAPPIAPAPPKPLLAHHAPARDAHARDKAPAPPASPQELCDADVSMLTPHGEERLVDMVWSRGIVRKCYLCPALATTQCLSSAKARLPVAQTLFCSFACLKKQWDRQGPRIAKLMASASLPADAALSHGQPRPFSFNNNGPATPDPAPASGLRPVMGGAWFSDEDEHAAQQAEVEALQLQHLQYVYNNKHNARLNAVVTQQNQATVVTGGACAPDPARDADACASCSTAHTGSCTASPSNASAAASPSAGAGGPTHIPGTGHPHPHLHPLVQQQQQAAAPIDTVVADSFLMPYSWTRYEALCCRFPAPFTDLFTVIGHGARYVPTQADQYCSLRIDAAPAVVVDQPVCKEASLVAAPPPRGRRHGRSAQDAAEAPSTPRVFIDPSLAQRWLRVETLPVVSVANSKPPRKRLLGLRNKPASPSGFKVLHYNILSDHLALPQLYHYCPPWALSWEYRRKLILQEIRQYDADIVCLQEVQGPHWKALEDDMAALGYQGKFYGKTRGTTFADGCATLYKRNKFVFRALHEISLDDLARDYLAVKNLHDERQYRRLLRGNVCVVVELEQIHPVSAGPPRKLCVANTHIFWDPTCPDVKLLQTWQLLSQLAYRFSQAPLIICGDLNSKPDSSVYEFLTSGSVKGRYPELDPSIPRFSHMPNAGEIRHPFHLSSAYAHVYGQCYPTAAHTPAEPLYTNYTAEFKGTLDYVFYSAKHLVCTEVLQLEDEETLAEYVALPSPKRPSDHIPLVAYIDWL
jgi:mRNA deadenylase 3'-5' endonuclease subunit Ccr4